MKYQCILFYSDGLIKKLELTKSELEETFDVWGYELSGELDYLEIKKLKK